MKNGDLVVCLPLFSNEVFSHRNYVCRIESIDDGSEDVVVTYMNKGYKQVATIEKERLRRFPFRNGEHVLVKQDRDGREVNKIHKILNICDDGYIYYNSKKKVPVFYIHMEPARKYKIESLLNVL